MSTSEALNAGFTIMLIVASLVLSFILPAEISVFLLILSYSTAIYAAGKMIGNDDLEYTRAFYFFFVVVVCTILIFTIIYWRYGLLTDGEQADISIFTALYFSITTWTTLGYGDFAPIPRIRHITSAQAILGYIGLGMLVVLLNGVMTTLANMRMEIREHNRRLRDKTRNTND
jgi:hypothetical protein